MALKLNISKESYDKLPDDIKAEYVEKDGKYALDVIGIEDTGALRRAKDRETRERKEAEKNLKTVKAELADMEGKYNRIKTADKDKLQDIATIEAEWKEKNDDLKAKLVEAEKRFDGYVIDQAVSAEATKLAEELSTAPPAMKALLMGRLGAEMVDSEVSLFVKDAAGNKTRSTIDDLRKELVADKSLAGIIKAGQASGSGAATREHNSTAGGVGSEGATDSGDKSYSQLSPAEKLAHLEAKIAAEDRGETT